MRTAQKHNYMVMELNALLNNKETRNLTIEHLNTYEGVTIKYCENTNFISIFIEKYSSTTKFYGDLFSLTFFDGFIDLLIDALQGPKLLNPYNEFYNFRDTLITKESYLLLLKKYVDKLKSYNNNIEVIDKVDLNCSPLHANLNQVIFSDNDKLSGFVVHPRKHCLYSFTCNDEDDEMIEDYNKSVERMLFNMYSYLLDAYNELD